MEEGVVTIVIGGRTMSMAVYYRVSTDTQSIEHQRHAVAEWCKEKGYARRDIIEFADEGITGAVGTAKRPGFAKLVDAIKAGKLRKCLVFESSRATRDFVSYLKFLELCRDQGCELEIIGKGVQGFESSQDMLIASIHAFLNHAEREKIAERTKSGLAKARAAGVKLGAPKGHKRNLGWRKDHPTELIEVIKKYTAKGLSTREIADLLGDRYTARPISYGTVRNLQQRYRIRKPA